MRRFTLIVATVAAATLGSSILAGAAPPVQDYQADLATLNDSGVTGNATLHLEGNQLTVSIQATGLETGAHPQHIHGSAESKAGSKGNATCPSSAADANGDANGDGIVDIVEGLPFYGPVQLSLEPFQANTVIDYQAIFTVDPAVLGPLQNRAIVLHGMTVDGSYVASTPVACGQIRVTPGG